MTEFKNKKEWDELKKNYPENKHRLWELFYDYIKENEKEIWETAFSRMDLADVKNIPYGKK